MASAAAPFPMDVPSSSCIGSDLMDITTMVADSLSSTTTASAAARKRRREKLASQRSTQATPEPATALASGIHHDPLVSVSSSTSDEADDAAALLDATLLDDVMALPLLVGSASDDIVLGMHSNDDAVAGMELEELCPPSLPAASSLPKRRRVSDCLAAPATAVVVDRMAAANKNKKPQMKYDPPPDVAATMTKEEAALWRREQRRKRNRESAAASRQRQRNRIAELEVELTGWKNKVQNVLDRIAALESAAGMPASNLFPDMHLSNQQAVPQEEDNEETQYESDDEMAAIAADALAAEQLLDVVLPVPPMAVFTIDVPSSKFIVSPPASPGRQSPASSMTSSLSSSDEETTDKVSGSKFAGQYRDGGKEEENNKVMERSDKMISRHAVS